MEIIRSFINKIKRVSKEDIVKVFSFTSLSTIVRMLTGFVSVKVVSMIIGPSGVAMVGQLNNFVTMGQNFASAGINNGVTKYIAEYKGQDVVKSYLSTSLRMIIGCSLFFGLLIICFNGILSERIMQDIEYRYLFIILGVALIFFALNNLLISVVNGYKQFKKYVIINIANSVLGLGYTLALVFWLGLKGALIGSVTFHSIMFFITIILVRKEPWLRRDFFNRPFEKQIAKKLLEFTAMTIVSVSLVPLGQMILRGYVMSEISTVDAGIWEGMNRLSNMYLSIITTSLAVYVLPRLSEITDKNDIIKELKKIYKIIMPVLFVGFVAIYFIKTPLIKILFTDEFLPMRSLFIWQLSGDFFKIFSWLLGYLLLAKSMTKAFIVTEVMYNGLFVLLAFVFMKFNGIVGITQAYLVNFVIYSIVLVLFVKYFYFNKETA